MIDLKEQPWQLLTLTAEEFLIGMSSLGTPQIQMVGAFADPDDPVPAGHRDIDIDLHRDGYFKTRRWRRPQPLNVDVIGMYCIRANDHPCWTTISTDGKNIDHELDLQAGQAVILDNNRLWHGRRGAVGKRLLIWIRATH